MILYEH